MQVPGKNPLSVLNQRVGLLLCLPALLTLLVTGWWTRFRADDYYFAARVRSEGTAETVAHMWDNAGGRLSGYVAVTTLVRLGPAWAPLVSVLALASVMAGMYFLIHQWWPAATSLAVSVTIAACSAFLVQSPVQNFLWVTGVGQVTIGIGVALGVITIAVYASRHASWSVRTLLAIVGLLGLCFYEVINLYVLVGAAGLWFISQDVRHDVGKRWALGILSSAALLTLIVMTVAPGSRERVAEERPTLVHAVKHAVIMSAEFWWRIVTSPALYLAFFVGFLVVAPSRLSWRWREVAIAILGVAALVGGTFVLTKWRADFTAPIRAQYVATIPIAMIAMAAGGVMRTRVVRPRAVSYVVGAAIGVALAVTAFGELADARRWERDEWGPRHEVLTDAPEGGSYTLKTWSNTGYMEDLTPDAHFWVNQAVADYYGAAQIVGR